MSDRILTDDDRENLTHIIRWHALAAGAHEEDTYLSLGVENTLTAVERIVAERTRARLAEAWDEGKRATWKALGAPFIWVAPENPYEGGDYA